MTYCARCGGSADEGDHAACRHKLALEPPRYCQECGRRMTVQVLPVSWRASCSRHGEVTPDRVT